MNSNWFDSNFDRLIHEVQDWFQIEKECSRFYIFCEFPSLHECLCLEEEMDNDKDFW